MNINICHVLNQRDVMYFSFLIKCINRIYKIYVSDTVFCIDL